MADKKLTPEEVKRNLLVVGCIRAWLDYKDIKQERLANILGVSKAAVSKWLQGKQSVNSQHLVKIAEVLGVSVIDLFFEPGKSPLAPGHRRAAELLLDLTPDDVARWLAFGEALRHTKSPEV